MGGNIQLVPLCTRHQLPAGSDSESDLPKPALLKPRRAASVPAARPTCSVPCSQQPLCSQNTGISRCPLPVGAPRCQHVTANNDPVKHLLMSAGGRQETLTHTHTHTHTHKKCTTPTSTLHVCALCTFCVINQLPLSLPGPPLLLLPPSCLYN